MSEASRRRAAEAAARDAVTAVAPDELVFFDAAAAEFFRDPERAVAGRRPRDEVLGYGPGEVVELVTPAALAISAAIVGAAVDRAGEAIVDQIVRVGRRLLRRRPRRGTGGAAPAAPAAARRAPDVTLDDLAQLRARVAEEARLRRLPDALVEPFTDALVASLVKHWSRAGDPGGGGIGPAGPEGTASATPANPDGHAAGQAGGGADEPPARGGTPTAGPA